MQHFPGFHWKGGLLIGPNQGAQQIFNGVVGSLNGPNYGAVMQVNGVGIAASYGESQLKDASSFKVIALDGEGKEMNSFQLPTGTQLTLNVTAVSIDTIKCTNADVRVESAKKIGKIGTQAGSIQITKVEILNSAHTNAGSIRVQECGKLGSANANAGSVHINKVNRAPRDSSPKRKSKKRT